MCENKKKKLCDEINERIHHVYGSVKNNEFSYGEIVKNYGDIKKNSDHMLYGYSRKISNGIHLIDERNCVDEYKKIRKLLSESEQIIFLGFGFDAMNIEVMGLREAFCYRGDKVQHENDYNNDGVKWPVIKYTNLGDSLIINKKIENLLLKHEHTIATPSGDKKTLLDFPSSNIIKSTKTVYDALSQDFLIDQY